MPKTAQRILADNARKLLDLYYEGRQNPFIVKTGFAPGTLTRILKATQTVNLASIEDFATLFGLETWQILSPDFDPKDPPKLTKTSDSKAHQIASEALRQIAQSSKQ